MNKFCGEMSELFPLLLIIITKLEKDVMLIMLRAWDKDKISESPTGFEPMTYSKKSDAPTTELRETGGEQGHTQGNDTTVKIRFFELPRLFRTKTYSLGFDFSQCHLQGKRKFARKIRSSKNRRWH